MPTSTTNFNLIKPAQEEFYDVNVQNNNMDIVDRLLKDMQEAISSGATEQELTNLREALATHLAEKASLTKAGHVQLSNSITGTSQTLASTEKAVKDAKDNAINYAKDYGLGSAAKDISNTDLNILDATGFYMGVGLVNNPTNDATEWFFIINIKHNNLYHRQLAFPFSVIPNHDRIFTRNQNSGTWGKWAEVKTTANSDIATGKYTGNGTSIDVYLGFRPRYVKVISYNNGNSGGFLENINNELYIGIGAINNNGGSAYSESFQTGVNGSGILITDGGFVVTPNPFAFLSPNGQGQTHSYIAMR